jgi:hypothetical protein
MHFFALLAAALPTNPLLVKTSTPRRLPLQCEQLGRRSFRGSAVSIQCAFLTQRAGGWRIDLLVNVVRSAKRG